MQAAFVGFNWPWWKSISQYDHAHVYPIAQMHICTYKSRLWLIYSWYIQYYIAYLSINVMCIQVSILSTAVLLLFSLLLYILTENVHYSRQNQCVHEVEQHVQKLLQYLRPNLLVDHCCLPMFAIFLSLILNMPTRIVSSLEKECAFWFRWVLWRCILNSCQQNPGYFTLRLGFFPSYIMIFLGCMHSVIAQTS